ncbi:hypothetical protein [Streptomyces sp. NRRL S-337]|uniref:hypothetical protein n=1 Tax=Streptomyces sp. NRRL S-337 TaxID=1463900 RepID=UPI000559C2C2|nr:hypothetical protein [Streptomyces sp. NRRL S-337]
MNTSTQTDWPEGVITRYLTVGGATVDIRIDAGRGFANAACTGCNATHEPFDYHGYYLDCEYSPVEAEEKALEAAREDAAKWAQTHAEKCRAMPRSAA